MSSHTRFATNPRSSSRTRSGNCASASHASVLSRLGHATPCNVARAAGRTKSFHTLSMTLRKLSRRAPSYRPRTLKAFDGRDASKVARACGWYNCMPLLGSALPHVAWSAHAPSPHVSAAMHGTPSTSPLMVGCCMPPARHSFGSSGSCTSIPSTNSGFSQATSTSIAVSARDAPPRTRAGGMDSTAPTCPRASPCPRRASIIVSTASVSCKLSPALL